MEKKRENERTNAKDMSRGGKKCASLVVEFALKRQRLMSSGGASGSSCGSYSSRIISSSFASSSFQNLALREGSCFRGKWRREMMQNFEGTTGRAFSSAAKDDEKKTKDVNKGGEKTGDESTSNPLAGMMFPWERAVLSSPRQEGPTPWWHKLYWFVFAFCVLLIASNRVREQFEQKDETEKREMKLKRNRRAMARALEGRSFVGNREYDPRTDSLRGGSLEDEEEEESDPFEGLEPHEIAALVAKEAPDGDVYAGWSPEEIQEYEEKSKKEREMEKKGVFVMPPTAAKK